MGTAGEWKEAEGESETGDSNNVRTKGRQGARRDKEEWGERQRG